MTSDTQITQNTLTLQNPWWESVDSIESDIKLLAIKDSPFFYNNPLIESLSSAPNCFHILRGPRQVGKTTLVKQLIKRFLTSKDYAPSEVLFMSCEAIEDFNSLQKILIDWLKDKKTNKKKKSIFFCMSMMPSNYMMLS